MLLSRAALPEAGKGAIAFHAPDTFSAAINMPWRCTDSAFPRANLAVFRIASVAKDFAPISNPTTQIRGRRNRLSCAALPVLFILAAEAFRSPQPSSTSLRTKTVPGSRGAGMGAPGAARYPLPGRFRLRGGLDEESRHCGESPGQESATSELSGFVSTIFMSDEEGDQDERM